MTRKLWVPLLVALLVMALIGPGMTAGAEPRATVTKALMIPASAFISVDPDSDYHNYANYVAVITGEGSFIAPLTFPVPVVNIKRITLYAYDNTGGYTNLSVCRSYPPDGTGICSGYISTVGASPDTQAVTTTDLDGRRVNTANHGASLWLYITDPAIKVYGAKVNYSYDTGV